ncbi:MAG: hypothetical protein K0R97_1084 [Oerskovia sp.]|nr:hypothetical protein [Oerskovia sp.]
MTAPLLFIDTETTSLAANRRAWEVAMIRVNPDDVDGVGHGISFFISDVDLRHADQQSLKVGRFYDRHPKYAPGLPDAGGRAANLEAKLAAVASLRSEYQAAVTIEQWTRGAILVGSNPGFDKEVVEPMLHRAGLTPAWHYRPVDVATLAAGFLHGVRRSAELVESVGLKAAALEQLLVEPAVLEVPWSSDALSRAVGLPPVPDEERHTAMGDARWVQRLYNLITTGRVIPALPRPEAVGGAS